MFRVATTVSKTAKNSGFLPSTRRFYSGSSSTTSGVGKSSYALGLGMGAAVGALSYYTLKSEREEANAASPTNRDWDDYNNKNTNKPTDNSQNKGGNLSSTLLGGSLVTIAVAAGVAAFLVTRYRRCPSNKILVIQGAFTGGKGAKCLHGGGAFVLPVVQQHSYLNLEPIQIEAPLRGALSLENIRVNVPSVFTVGISTKAELAQNAAERLLGLEREEVAHQAKDIIFGQLRQVVASMRIEEINKSREQFVHNVKENIEHELEKIGLELINVNITDLTDDAGYLAAMGKKAAQEAIQKAEVDVAEQEKFGQIGVTEFRKDTTLRKAELLRLQLVGEATAKYSQQAEVKAQERDMRIRVAALDAETIRGENEAKEQIALSNAKLAMRQAEAYKDSETRKKEAEAAVKEAEARAEAKAAVEIGNRIEADKRAELEAPAKAIKAKILVDAEAQAEEARIVARGQAEALYAKLEAEARGQLEILKSKADGMKMMVQSAGGSQEAFQLLMLDHVDKLAETASKAISNIKFDKVVVWDGGNKSGPGETGNAASNFLRGLAGSLPPTMHLMKDIAGVEMPSYFGKILDDSSLGHKRITLQKLFQQEKEALSTQDWEKIESIRREITKLEAEIKSEIELDLLKK